MNHIYFTALRDGAGLAAELAAGDGAPRVYLVEPTGPYEDDPNVTDKKFPGNPTRSYRSSAPLKVIGEVTDWARLTPEALRNVVTGLRPGAWVAAGGGKWAAPMMVALNSTISLLHAPYVRDFSGFDRPWRHLERLVEDVQVRELGFGSGYVMTGRTPA